MVGVAGRGGAVAQFPASRAVGQARGLPQPLKEVQSCNFTDLLRCRVTVEDLLSRWQVDSQSAIQCSEYM